MKTDEKLTIQICNPHNYFDYIVVDIIGKAATELKRNKSKIIVPKENIVFHNDFSLTQGTYLMIADRNISDYFVYKINNKNIILMKPEIKHCDLRTVIKESEK